MASLKQRGGVYYIVFTRRVEGALQQRVFSLGTPQLPRAARLKGEFEERYAREEIDPFDGWSPKADGARDSAGSPKPVALEAVATEFLKTRSHTRERTLLGYRALVRKLTSEISRSMPIHLVTEADVRALCFKPSYSTATRTTYLRFCKMLFKWAHDAGFVERDVAKGVKYPTQNRNTSDKVINEGHLAAVIAAYKGARRSGGRGAMRHLWFRPLVNTLFYAGLRAREVVELTWDKVDLASGYVRVTNTKSGRERVIPIRAALAPTLRVWHRLQRSPARGLVFFKGRPGALAVPLTTEHISKVYKAYARLAALPERANLHGLRHSCATELLRAGMAINEVALILGHSTMDVTRIYQHLSERDLKNSMERLGL